MYYCDPSVTYITLLLQIHNDTILQHITGIINNTAFKLHQNTGSPELISKPILDLERKWRLESSSTSLSLNIHRPLVVVVVEIYFVRISVVEEPPKCEFKESMEGLAVV